MMLLQGCYQIRQEISSGMEVAYLGLDTRLGRPVFIKELAIPHDADAAAVESMTRRFHSQALTGAMVDHPHVVKTLDAFDEDGRSYIVLEFVRGRALTDVLSERGRLPLTEAAEITCQILDALDTAGEAGVVHGDIKPANVLLTDEGRVKIVDFGIAVEEGQRAPQRAGTPNYMAPEQLRGKPLDRRADLFSASVVLYHLASGERPFAADSVKGILDRIEYDEPRMPSDWSPAFCSVLRRGLSKEPSARYPSARAMLHDLQSACPETDPRPSTERSDAILALESRQAWERRLGLALGGASAAVVIGLVLFTRLSTG